MICRFVFFLKQKKPLQFAEVLCIFLKKNYNSISAEYSGILQDIILLTVNFIFFCFVGANLRTFFKSTKQISIYFLNSIEQVEYVKFSHIKLKKQNIKFAIQNGFIPLHPNTEEKFELIATSS